MPGGSPPQGQWSDVKLEAGTATQQDTLRAPPPPGPPPYREEAHDFKPEKDSIVPFVVATELPHPDTPTTPLIPFATQACQGMRVMWDGANFRPDEAPPAPSAPARDNVRLLSDPGGYGSGAGDGASGAGGVTRTNLGGGPEGLQRREQLNRYIVPDPSFQCNLAGSSSHFAPAPANPVRVPLPVAPITTNIFSTTPPTLSGLQQHQQRAAVPLSPYRQRAPAHTFGRATASAAATMAARPPKRPSDSEEDSGSFSQPSPLSRSKLQRHGGPHEDFSTVIKTKLQSYTRTGQACDRCKVRKIRCDALEDGCTNCKAQTIECVVTDRVTGRTERRGYMLELERQNEDMLPQLRALEALLQANGIEVHPFEPSQSGQAQTPPAGYPLDATGTVRDPFTKNTWTKCGRLWVKNYRPKSSYALAFPRALLKSRPADTHLGLSADVAPLSSIKGTRLSILGTTIDLTSFDAPDVDEPQPDVRVPQPLYNKSVQSFLQSTMNINPPLEPLALPPRKEGLTYSEWYFMMVFPFLPMLHGPTHTTLLMRMYDEEGFVPSIPELVMVHMVFATIYYQYAARNLQNKAEHEQLNDLSNKHYHFALSKFFDLATSQTFEAVQAMAMIAAHSRSFPKPSCGCLVISYAFGRAIDLNLHRATKKSGQGTNLENELRKRLWWSILVISVTLNGRLGKPMPIAVEEFDVEFPEAIPDEMLTADGIDNTRQGLVTYEVGLAGFRIVPLFMEMYANIYSVRRDPDNYPTIVGALEDQLKAWRDSLPDSLKLGVIGQAEQQGRVYALYAQLYALEFRLCLRHPSVAMTTDQTFMAENTRVCEETSAEMLQVVHSLLTLKSLDTTWYQMSVFVAAIFSTLVAHWERRFQASSSDITALRQDMATWLVILNESASNLGAGSGTRVSSEIGATIERTIAWIEHDMGRKDAMISPQTVTATKDEFSRAQAPTNGTSFQNGQTAYPGPGFPDQAASRSVVSGPPAFETGGPLLYAAGGPATPTAQSGSIQSNPLVAFASHATQHGAEQSEAASSIAAAADMLWRPPGEQVNVWNQWTAAIADSQDRYSANALLTLGGSGSRDTETIVTGGPGLGVAVALTGTGASVPSHASQWPLLLFDGNDTTNGS